MDRKTKQSILRRLSIVRGQVEGLKEMIEKDKYCIDVLNQSSAVQKALGSIDSYLLENHLGTCLKKTLKIKNRSKKAIKEVVQIFKQAKK